MFALLVVLGAAVAGFVLLDPFGSDETAAPASPSASAPTPAAPTRTSAAPAPQTFDRTQLSIDAADSTWVVVDKLRPLEPIDAAAAAAGLHISVESAYRSYDYQQGLFSNSVARFGQDGAEHRSARPGFSEHQTGLAADVGGGGCDIESCFATTAEGRWVAADAYRFGFVVRYPDGAQPITGYKYEPWHVRYVGVELATELHDTGGATLEEFFGLPAAPTYAPG